MLDPTIRRNTGPLIPPEGKKKTTQAAKTQAPTEAKTAQPNYASEVKLRSQTNPSKSETSPAHQNVAQKPTQVSFPEGSSTIPDDNAENALLLTRENLLDFKPEELENLLTRIIQGDKQALASFRKLKGNLAQQFSQTASRYASKGGDPRISKTLSKMSSLLKNMNFTGNGVRYLQSMVKNLGHEMNNLAAEIRGEAKSNPNSFSQWELGQLKTMELLFDQVQSSLNIDTNSLLETQKQSMIQNFSTQVDSLTHWLQAGNATENLEKLNSEIQNLESDLKDYLELSGVKDPEAAPEMLLLNRLQDIQKSILSGNIEQLPFYNDQVAKALDKIEDPAIKGMLNKLVKGHQFLKMTGGIQQKELRKDLVEAAKLRYNEQGTMGAQKNMGQNMTAALYGGVEKVTEAYKEELREDAPEDIEAARELAAYEKVEAAEAKIDSTTHTLLESKFETGIKNLERLKNSDNLYAVLMQQAKSRNMPLDQFMALAFDADPEAIKGLTGIRELIKATKASGVFGEALDKMAQKHLNEALKPMVQFAIDEMKDELEDIQKEENPYALLKKYPNIRSEVYKTLGFKSDVVKESLKNLGDEDSFPPVVDQSDLLEMIEQGKVTNDAEIVFLVQAEDQDDDEALASTLLDVVDFAASVALSSVTFGLGAAYTIGKGVAEGFIADDQYEEAVAGFHANVRSMDELKQADNARELGAIVANAAVSVVLDKVNVFGRLVDGGKALTSKAANAVSQGFEDAFQKTYYKAIGQGLSNRAAKELALEEASSQAKDALFRAIQNELKDKLSPNALGDVMKKLASEMKDVDFSNLVKGSELFKESVGNLVNSEIQNAAQ